MSPSDAVVAQYKLLGGLGITEHEDIGYIEGEAHDSRALEGEGEILLLTSVGRPIQIDLAIDLLPIRHRLRQQRAGFIEEFLDNEGVVDGVGNVADAAHRMIQPEHEDLVGVRGLAAIADGVLGGTAGRNEAHFLAGDSQVAVAGHARTPL